jgi:hypothetical protein
MMTVTCASCGQENRGDARFCHACGKQLGQQSGASATPVQTTIVIPAAAVHTGAWVRAIGIYLASEAVGCLALSGTTALLAGLVQAAIFKLGPLMGLSSAVLAQLSSPIYGLFGVLMGTAAVGLFRRSVWAPLWTKVTMVVTAAVSLVGIAMMPPAGMVILGILYVVIAVLVWVFLSKPATRAYFDKE